jgi:hypothetical protein
MKLLITTLSVISLITLLSCNKNKEEVPIPSQLPVELPAYTEKGANTFSYILNEEELIISPSIVRQDFVNYSIFNPKTKEFGVGGAVASGFGYTSIYIENLIGKGEYSLNVNENSNAPYNYGFACFDFNKSDNYFKTDSLHTGKIQITRFDTIIGVISGKFN